MNLDDVSLFQKRITGIETNITDYLLDSITKSRNSLMSSGVLDKSGISSVVLQNEFQLLRSNHVNIMTMKEDDFRKLLFNFYDKQADAVSGISMPTARDLYNGNAGNFEYIYKNIYHSDPVYLQNLSSQMRYELTNLVAQNADEQTIFKRLFSMDDADMSVFRRVNTSMQTEVIDKIWKTTNYTLDNLYGYAGKTVQKKIWNVVVATLDSKTTDTCLRLHGQRQEVGTPFILTGSQHPFGTRLTNPPFHYNCRSIVVMEVEDMSTWYDRTNMRSAAVKQRATQKKEVLQHQKDMLKKKQAILNQRIANVQQKAKNTP